MVFVIEGNIGCGKSSVINVLSTKYNCIEEPVSEWTLLEDFYKNPKDFGTFFQHQVLCSYYKIFKNLKFTGEPTFIERSPWSARNVFQYLHSKKYPRSRYFFSFLDSLYSKIPIDKISVIFYLDLEPTQCLNRIYTRQRQGEHDIPLELLKNIESRYYNILSKTNMKVIRIKVLNKSPVEIANEILSYIVI